MQNVLQNISAFPLLLSQTPSLFFLSLCLILNPVLMKMLLPVKQWLYLFNEPVPMCCLIAPLFPLSALWITKLLVFDYFFMLELKYISKYNVICKEELPANYGDLGT